MASRRTVEPGTAFAIRSGQRSQPAIAASERRNTNRMTKATHAQEMTMNWDRIEGNWKQFKGKVKEKWGELTDDELTEIGGKKDQLVGKIQERYGYQRDRAERELDEVSNTW
jgi:uncharacterized protein YjbJ (UPF0337 family)